MSIAVLVTQPRASLPGGTPFVALSRFLVRSFQSSLGTHFPFARRRAGQARWARNQSTAAGEARVELPKIGIKVPALEEDQALGFECTLIRLERQIGDGDVGMIGDQHQQASAIRAR